MIEKELKDSLQAFLSKREYPCVAAKEAVNKGTIKMMTAEHIGCPASDSDILAFMYDFIVNYHHSDKGFHSAVIIFSGPQDINETEFDIYFWQRLSALRKLDSKIYSYDERVSSDPSSPTFSFSLMGEAFFVLALHPGSSRAARQFEYPTLIFNPHAQFEQMRAEVRYDKMKAIVRKRDTVYSGSINPMLTDYGNASEVYQYSGRKYDADWKCPLNTNHE